MKLWLDDVREAPEGYVRCKSVDEAKHCIMKYENDAEEHYAQGVRDLENGNEAGMLDEIDHGNEFICEVIDMDHDAGDYESEGGDYIKLLDWLEETGRNYPIRIHSANAVGVENMRRIIERNGWKEIT